jgi:hypothetical protein
MELSISKYTLLECLNIIFYYVKNHSSGESNFYFHELRRNIIPLGHVEDGFGKGFNGKRKSMFLLKQGERL